MRKPKPASRPVMARPRRLPPTLLRLVHHLQKAPPRTLIILSLLFHFLEAILILLLILKPPHKPSQQTPYDLATPQNPSYAFFFTTGRSGTQHYSQILHDTNAHITHQQEHAIIPTKQIVDQVYRHLSRTSNNLTDFTTNVIHYLHDTKLPYLKTLTTLAGKSRYIYTGHVPLSFGHGPGLLEVLPKGMLRVVRARRDRIGSALSLMGLGKSVEDAWDENDEVGMLRRRWFPRPDDVFVRLKVGDGVWGKLNRFQRYLWYVDDVECRWQDFKRRGGFEWLEVSIEGLEVFDGGNGYEELARFLGVGVWKELVGKRGNSMQRKGRRKLNVSEEVLRMWDEEYKSLVGACVLEDGQSYRWQDSAT